MSTAAAKWLAWIGTTEAYEALASGIGREPGAKFHEQSVEVCVNQLLEVGQPAVPSLVKQLRQGCTQTRERAAEALGRLARDGKLIAAQLRRYAVTNLACTIKDSEASLRRAAGRAMAHFGPDAAPVLKMACRVLNDPEDCFEGDQFWAADVLKAIGQDAGPALVALLKERKASAVVLDILEAMDYRDPSLFELVQRCWKDAELRTPTTLRYLARLSPVGCVPSLSEALRDELNLASEAAQIAMQLKTNDARIVEPLDPSIKDAAMRAFESVRDLIRQRKPVDEERAFWLAAFGESARPHFDPLREELNRTGGVSAASPWLLGAMACLAPDPKEYFVRLLQPMQEADTAQAPLGAGRLGNVLAYMSAWCANSPAMNSQKALERALALLGPQGRQQLGALKDHFPAQVQNLLA